MAHQPSSKAAGLRAMREANYAARKKPNPFEDATPEASGTARTAPSGSSLVKPSRNSVRASPSSKRGRPRIGEQPDKPWISAGMSERTWYRRKKEQATRAMLIRFRHTNAERY